MSAVYRRDVRTAGRSSFVAAAAVLLFVLLLPASAVADDPQITGAGSSFAGIEFQQWTRDVSGSPYNLKVNYQSSSSGQGRQQFRDKVVDFGVSDIRYTKFDGSPPPDNTYIYVPITAGGLAVMYNLKAHGLGESDKALQLSDYSLCAIFTGGIQYWDDDHIKSDNPGVTLPHVAVHPVMRSDPAGTNFVLEEYCIARQQAMYFAFADYAQQHNAGDVPHEPTSTWPIVSPITGADGSEGVADKVAAGGGDGYVTAVETGYAAQRHIPVAAVKNSAGKYVLPTEQNVAAALSYATQLSDGTHNLNFNPPAENAYNPSTYSYLLARTTGFDAAKGGTLTKFANYALTIGQTEAGKLKYASIGRNLINFGLELLKKVPGHVDPTQDELNAIPKADAFNTQVANASNVSTTASGPTATATSASPSTTGTTAGGGSGTAPGAAPGSSGGGSTGTGSGTGSSSTPGGASSTGSGSRTGPTGGGSGTVRAAGTGGAADVDPSVALDPMASTGAPHQVIAAFGLGLVLIGEWARTNLRRRRRVA